VIRKDAQESWQKALDQLKKIPNADTKALSITGGNLVKMALVVVPFYQASKIKDKLAPVTDKEKIEEIYDGFVTGLTPSPNWSCMWLLHERLQETESYADGRHEVYPCVGIVAKVDNSLSI
jgi:hypothetical protein